MSADLLAVHLALRNRALSLVVATTGLTNLSATATGYHRAAGSFVSDGFLAGMEIVPAGFAANTPRVIQGVTASDITTTSAPTVEAESGGRSLSVGIPTLRAFENVAFTPTSNRHYFEEDFVPATNSLLTMPAQSGVLRETGLYIPKWYGLSGVGVSALRKSVDALKALFAPGTLLVAGANTVRIGGDQAPQTGQIIPLSNGWSALTLTVPWWVLSQNQIAA